MFTLLKIYNIKLNTISIDSNFDDIYLIENNKNLLLNNNDTSIVNYRNSLLTLSYNKNTTNYSYLSLGLFVESFVNYKTSLFNRINWQSYDINLLIFLNNFYINLVKLYKKNTKSLVLYNSLMLIFLALFFKDIVLLKNFFTLKFKYVTFKKHKKLLAVYRYILKYISTYLIEKKIISGLKLTVAGKIGMAGSSKKKKWMFKNGELKLSSKTTKLKYEVFNVWTKAGTLGLKLYLAYN